jgi:ferredoxin
MAVNKILPRDDFQRLISLLRTDGYQVIGPTLRQGAVVYEEIQSTSDLPEGWIDLQDGGSYRLERSETSAFFGYVVGPQSWKQFLCPPQRKLLTAEQTGKSFSVSVPDEKPIKRAFVGVRPCEIAAMAVQDKVMMEGPFVDLSYRLARQNAIIIAVNCARAGGTCFCVSMGTGPKASSGFDIALTELIDQHGHRFLVEAGSEIGIGMVTELALGDASESDIEAGEKAIANASANMGRTLDTSGIKELLYTNFDHGRWNDAASRCLSCANCTMVCPTCFCATVDEATDLSGKCAERWRKWDSCFTVGFSYIHGGSIRTSGMSRYRQWMTHKLAYWQDQFGTSGCVGCGRCITWCPVGIDITEEARAIRHTR